MMHTTLSRSPESSGRTLWVSAFLGAAVVVFMGYHLLNALGSDDAGRLETLIMRSLASQLDNGFGFLYGPFDGANRLVMIHAPLYYRIAGLVAWLLNQCGIASLQAALIAGRSVSVASTIGLLFVVYQLCVLDGAPGRSGFWAACLIAASPILGVLAVMVRPDTLAVFLQTLGVLLVLKTLHEDSPRSVRLIAAYVAFALAFCIKQHDVVDVTVSSVFLIAAWFRRGVKLGPIVLANATFFVVVGLYFGIEQVVTHGLMSRSVFELPGGPFRQINYASWSHVQGVVLSILKLSVGLVALAAACAIAFRWGNIAQRLDGVIVVYFFAEVAALLPLCLFNKGSAENYALQTIVFACILIGRAISRALETDISWKVALIVSAAAFVLVRDAKLVVHSTTWDRSDRVALRTMLADRSLAGEGPDERYFVDLPQHNRRFGAFDLIHDEWLFTAYEAVGDVEPRSSWLRSAFVTGPVRTIIMPDTRQTIPGLAESLPELGYDLVNQFGRYRVWERRRAISPHPSSREIRAYRGDDPSFLRHTSIAPKRASG